MSATRTLLNKMDGAYRPPVVGKLYASTRFWRGNKRYERYYHATKGWRTVRVPS